MGAIDYYKSVSGGLPAGLSLADYELAYFASVSGLPASSSLSDHKAAFYTAQTGIPTAKLAEMSYYAAQLTTTIGSDTMDDLRSKFITFKGF
jgi:hypothetical protein